MPAVRCPTPDGHTFRFRVPAHLDERIRYFSQWRRKERDLSSPLSDPKVALSVVGFVRDTERPPRDIR